MPTLNVLISPLDPLFSVGQIGNDQNSYYDDDPRGGDTFMLDEWEQDYGPFRVTEPMEDAYSIFYGSDQYEDVGLLASCFDLMQGVTSQNPYDTWIFDQLGYGYTDIGATGAVSTTFLSGFNIGPGLPGTYLDSTGAVVVHGSTITLSGLGQSDLHYLQFNLGQSSSLSSVMNSIQQAGSLQEAPLTLALSYLGPDITSVGDVISGLDPNRLFHFVIDGHAIDFTGQDLKNIYDNFAFNVTSNVDYGYNRGGATGHNGSGYYSNVDSATLVGYLNSYGANGIFYYIFHEVSHNIPRNGDVG